MYPNQPAQYPTADPRDVALWAQQYPTPQAAMQYPAAPQGYAPAPQYPTMPHMGYPMVPGYPAQYPGMPGYPPATPPVQPTAPGSLDGFYGQPSASGGPSFKFKDANGVPQIGKTYVGVVARPIGDGDVRQATDNNGTPQFYKGGKPKFIMVVPMLVPAGPEFPEGQAGWWVKGQARDELVRAMSEAGAPAGPPEAGAVISVTLVSTRPIPNMNPAFNYRVVYTRPTGDPAATVAAMAAQMPAQVAPAAYAPAPQYAAAPVGYPAQFPQHIDQHGQGHYAQPAQPVYAAPAGYPAAPQYAAQPAYAAPVAPAVAPAQAAPAAMAAVAAGQPGPVVQAAPAAALPGLNAQQLALMAQLTGAGTSA